MRGNTGSTTRRPTTQQRNNRSTNRRTTPTRNNRSRGGSSNRGTVRNVNRSPARVRYRVRPTTTPNGNRVRSDNRAAVRRGSSGSISNRTGRTPRTNARTNRINRTISNRSRNRYNDSLNGRRGTAGRVTRGTGRNISSRRPNTRVGGRASRGRNSAPRLNPRSSRIPRRSTRFYAGNRYRFGFRSNQNRRFLSRTLGLGFLWHLGWNNCNYYVRDPFYCNYSVGWGFNHYHRGVRYLHPLNYGNWWYPNQFTYCPPSYIYVNNVGDFSPYPATTVIGSTTYTSPDLTGDVASAPIAPMAPGAPPAKSEAEAEADSIRTLVARHVTLGDFYFKEARFSDAAESYLRAIANASEDASLHFLLADALFALGDYHYAAFIISKAVRLDGTMAYAEADKRKFYGDTKLFSKHLDTLRNYLKEKPYDTAAHLVLAYNLKFSGDSKGALKAFQRVVELDPDHTAGQAFLDAATPAPEKKDAVEGPAKGSSKLPAEAEKAPASKTPAAEKAKKRDS